MAEDPLSKAFDVEPYEAPGAVVQPSDERKKRYEEYADADYAFARESIISTILKATDALDELVDLAHSSQHPRAYEVVHGLVKTIVDANGDLLDLTRRGIEIQTTAPASTQPTPGTQINNMFIGSTEQLQTLLRNNGIDTGLKTIDVTPKKDENGKE